MHVTNMKIMRFSQHYFLRNVRWRLRAMRPNFASI